MTLIFHTVVIHNDSHTLLTLRVRQKNSAVSIRQNVVFLTTTANSISYALRFKLCQREKENFVKIH